jgi:hypothetical protein
MGGVTGPGSLRPHKKIMYTPLVPTSKASANGTLDTSRAAKLMVERIAGTSVANAGRTVRLVLVLAGGLKRAIFFVVLIVAPLVVGTENLRAPLPKGGARQRVESAGTRRRCTTERSLPMEAHPQRADDTASEAELAIRGDMLTAVEEAETLLRGVRLERRNGQPKDPGAVDRILAPLARVMGRMDEYLSLLRAVEDLSSDGLLITEGVEAATTRWWELFSERRFGPTARPPEIRHPVHGPHALRKAHRSGYQARCS